ncbi:dipeptidyl-peptidase-4 [Endobacter medicaginis]|uniref:Dipeptidyl-peptidase-4 n=2 Tax=Endobacter medicaginis TaxID=1181271 RepID=A0A839V2K4_9PROT|nr:DPP IV N-terminal domain-containing protein [Endobacter medicaginis]MBB3173759.1 dipeptidyl-peptidase-4 [Endobacter medicaginis]MCX5474961.1 DPP IV N-terminal domain-containing protein [Endobacter medicaginis]NVN28776.1 S9 family peptidase [Endobacter medicaginis]
MRRALLVSCLTLLVFGGDPAFASGPESCFATLAATRNGTLGRIRSPDILPGGHGVVFLRSGPRDPVLHLYRTDPAGTGLRELSTGPEAPEQLSTEEKARRERARLSLSGITAIFPTRDGASLLAVRGGTLLRVDTTSGATTTLPGSWIAPRLSPDGRRIAAVRDDDLHVIDLASGAEHALTTGGSRDLTHGLAEFAAAEELARPEGIWWSPDSTTLLYEEADSRDVELHYIADPAHPERPPTAFRYPRAGTANAKLRLGLIDASGGPTRWVQWDADAFPYLGRVVWRGTGGLFLVVLDRAQRQERVLRVDPDTGATTAVLTDTDPAWLDLTPLDGAGGLDLPYALPGGDFLWAAQRGAQWHLERHHADGSLAATLTPDAAPYAALLDVDPAGHDAIIAAAPDRLDTDLRRLDLDTGRITPIVTEPGRHTGHFSHDIHDRFIDTLDGADGRHTTTLRDRDGTLRATLPDAAEPLPMPIHASFTTAGPRALDTLVIRPDRFDPHHAYPVVLSVYGGPGHKQVNRTPALYAPEQCLADRGYVVVALDGRGTPGRDHDFERATQGDLIDAPLTDQIDALTDLGRHDHSLDLTRTGIYGWSFGGTFAAMATIRRPDIFAVGVAGAPVTDFATYDTAYTERYLGTPQANPDAYRLSAVLTYASQLSRPLLLLHGLADDNVYFLNTLALTQALLRAGKPYDLRLLPGTHMLTDPVLRARIDETRARYLDHVLRP